MADVSIAGQLNAAERRILTDAVLVAPQRPRVILEIGTWLGGGSTLHFLRALEQNGEGHLWGVEADRSTYEQMLENIRAAAPESLARFTPLFGFSDEVIPRWLETLGPEAKIDIVFLDGGDNPMEQITEFKLLADRVRVGGRVLAHDAKLRKGKWLRPYLSILDNWQVTLHDVSEEGLLSAVKLRNEPSPKSQSAAETKLLSLRLRPLEFVGAILPTPICALLLKLMPTRLARRLSQGRC
jgi:predicted O-methyltransferase YrrM